MQSQRNKEEARKKAALKLLADKKKIAEEQGVEIEKVELPPKLSR